MLPLFGMAARREARWRLAVLCVPLALAGLLAAHYLPFIADDALISLRYADRLLAGHGLTWTDGERVEGYSNLLWILLVALLGAFGLDLVHAAWALGFVASAVALVAVSCAVDARARLASFVAALAVASAGPWAVWTVGGLEVVLLGALLALGFVAAAPLLEPASPAESARRTFARGIPLALACWTRPDAPLFVAVLAACATAVPVVGSAPGSRAAQLRTGLLRALLLGAAPALAVLGQLVFRLAYYGDFVPNTAHVKAHFGVRLDAGVAYLQGALASLWPLFALAALGVAAAVAGHRRGAVAAAVGSVAVWLAYVASVGGDIFPAYRLLVPLVVLLALSAAWGVEWASAGLGRDSGPRRFGSLVAGVLVTACLLAFARAQLGDPEMKRAETERWEWHGEVLGKLLAEGFGERQPLLAVTAAGTLPYFSRLPSLDMAGLNDRHIARVAPAPGYKIGHDRADADYVLRRQPDLVVFGGARGRRLGLLPARTLLANGRFKAEYWPATFRASAPRKLEMNAFVRLAGKLGIERAEGEVWVPGWLFGRRAIGELLDGGVMGARLSGRQEHRGPKLTLAPGSWSAEVVPDDGHVRVSVSGRRVRWLGRGRPLEVLEASTVRVLLDTGGRAVSIRGVRLRSVKR